MKKGESLPCNGRQKNDCPMDGKCRTMKTVYKCIASVPTKPDKNYIIWRILLLGLNNLLFGQFTVYHLNNLLFERFTVKSSNILMFKQLTKIDTLIKLYHQIV